MSNCDDLLGTARFQEFVLFKLIVCSYVFWISRAEARAWNLLEIHAVGFLRYKVKK